MAFTDVDFDVCVMKTHRATSRRRHIIIKRSDYERSKQDNSEERTPPRPSSAKPRSATRGARRAHFAKEMSIDVPDLVTLAHSGLARNTCVPTVVKFTPEVSLGDRANINDECCASSDLETQEGGSDTLRSPRMDSCDSDSTAPLDMGEPHEQSCDPTSLPEIECAGEAVPESDEHSVITHAPAHRERILREVVGHLRAQITEERMLAKVVQADKEALEKKVKESVDKTPKTKFTSVRKVALQVEKHRAVEMRKRRHQEAQIHAVKEKVDRQLQEAERTREEAEAEAIAATAKHLAEVDSEARICAEALVQAETLRAEGERDVLMQQHLEQVAMVEADAKANLNAQVAAIKQRTEIEVLEAKAKAEEIKVAAEEEVRSLKARAKIEALVIKGRAEIEARDLKEAMDAEERKLSEAVEHARCSAESEARAQAQEAARRAETDARREAALALKNAKSLEQQRSKQFRKKAQQERQQVHERELGLEALRAQAAEEATALRRQAVMEAADMKAKARDEAKAIRESIVAEAHLRSLEVAMATQAASEAQAVVIRQAAEEEVCRLRQELANEKEKVSTDARKTHLEAQSDDDAWLDVHEDGHVEALAIVDVDTEDETSRDDQDDEERGVDEYDWNLLA